VLNWKSPSEWKRIGRYYQAGFINMIFGYGLFALMISFGMNMYLAQILSHICGVTFNYFTYSRYTFSDHDAHKLNFILSYAINYVINVSSLAILSLVIRSPYLAGFTATMIASAINYLALRHMVFRERG
jgi:putative flippase GtrA